MAASPALKTDPHARGNQKAPSKPFVWRPGVKKFDEATKRAFLDEYVKSGLLYAAAEAVGVSGFTVLEAVKEDEGFAAAYHQAKELCTDTTLVHEARRRALQGISKPIVGGKNKDEIVAYEQVYSDRLHELLLKAYRREEFGDQLKSQVSVTGGVLALSAQPMASTDWERVVTKSGEIIEGSARQVAQDPPAALPAPELGEAEPEEKKQRPMKRRVRRKHI